VVPKGENHQCWKQRKWLCGTKANQVYAAGEMFEVYGKKPNHVCAVGGMLEVGFIILCQIMIVPRTNVRSWLDGTKLNHICAADGMLVALC
jgi:hypothetical protein